MTNEQTERVAVPEGTARPDGLRAAGAVLRRACAEWDQRVADRADIVRLGAAPGDIVHIGGLAYEVTADHRLVAPTPPPFDWGRVADFPPDEKAGPWYLPEKDRLAAHAEERRERGMADFYDPRFSAPVCNDDPYLAGWSEAHRNELADLEMWALDESADREAARWETAYLNGEDSTPSDDDPDGFEAHARSLGFSPEEYGALAEAGFFPGDVSDRIGIEGWPGDEAAAVLLRFRDPDYDQANGPEPEVCVCGLADCVMLDDDDPVGREQIARRPDDDPLADTSENLADILGDYAGELLALADRPDHHPVLLRDLAERLDDLARRIAGAGS